MSYYGGDRPPTPRLRRRAVDINDYANASAKPVTKKVGDGRRTRFTVETGGDEAKFQQQIQIEDAIKREEKVARLDELRRLKHRPSPLHRPTARNDRADFLRRRNSYPIRTSDASPVSRHSRPATDDVEIWSPLESSEDDDEYDFDLPKPAKGLKSQDGDVLKVAEPVTYNKFDKPSQTAKSSFHAPIREINISHSRWLGSSLDRGELGVEIITLPENRDVIEKQYTPSMKWYHLERYMMNFEEFTTACLSMLQLPEKEHRDVTKLLRDVQKRFEKQRHHGRDMEPDCVSDVFYNNSTSKRDAQPTESVMFLNFPYFSLDTYSSTHIRALTPGSPMHPLRPILQAHFYATSRQRELEQVMTRIPGNSAGDCLHLSQIWCLIINGSTMITCSRLPIEQLGGDSVKVNQNTSPREHAYIKVSATGNRDWRVPVSRETTWPTFLALFADIITNMEVYGGTLEFEDQDGLVDAKRWPIALEKALESPIEFQMREARSLKDDPSLQMDDESEMSIADASDSDAAHTPAMEDLYMPIAQEKPSQEFAVPKAVPTLLLETNRTLQLFKHTGSSSYMRSLADGFHTVLRTTKRSGDRTAYRKCPAAKAEDIESWLAAHSRVPASDTVPREAASLIKYKRRIASISRYLFCLFWPPEFEHPITEKYWGAIHQILVREREFFDKGHRDPTADVTEASNFYHVLHDNILPVALSLTREFLTYESDLRPLPEAFSKAWLHATMGFVITAQTTLGKKFSLTNSGIGKHLQAVKDEFSTAQNELSARLRGAELEELEICNESSLLALFISRLARDNMRGQTPDVARAYGDYFQGLEFKVIQDPVPRSHQETIRFFLQEVEAILSTLQNQMSVVEIFQKSLEQQKEDRNALLEDAIGESRQALVIERCEAWIGGRIDKFKGLQQRALELGEWHRNEMDTNKDRQEKAILVFTIVTIIFLPLSFVASVFGMNTKDVRDMPYKQWLYWAAGLPLTVVVVVASLWFAGELESLGRWIARRMSRSKKSSGYEELKNEREEQERSWQQRGLRVQKREEDLEQRPQQPKRRTTYPIKAS